MDWEERDFIFQRGKFRLKNPIADFDQIKVTKLNHELYERFLQVFKDKDKIVLYYNSNNDWNYDLYFDELRKFLKGKLIPTVFKNLVFAKYDVLHNSTTHLNIKTYDLPWIRVYRKEENVRFWKFESWKINSA